MPKWIRQIVLGCVMSSLVACAGELPPEAGPMEMKPSLVSPTATAAIPSPVASQTAAVLPVTPLPASATPAGAVQASPTPPAFPIPGIELESIQPAGLDLALRAGAYWLRRNALDWSQVEPQEGQRHWEAAAGLDKDLQLAGKSGVQVILVIRVAPEWAQAQPGVPCGFIKPEKLDAFARFVHDAVVRYSAAPYTVKYWELGNEPDIDARLIAADSPFGCMGDLEDAFYGGGRYAALIKQAYPQVKAADPQSQVLVGGLLADCDPINPPEGQNCTPSRYLEGILRAGGGSYLDGVSFHAYDYYRAPYQYDSPNWHSAWNVQGPVLVHKARYLRSVLAAYQVPQKFLINTEAGLVCGKDGREPVCQANEFLLTKAAYVVEANFAALAEGLRGNVWFSLTGWRGTQLIEGGQPNQAYQAYQFSAKQLLQAVFVRAITEYPGLRGYEVNQQGRKVWLLVPADGQNHTVQLPAPPAAIYDIFGNSQPVGETVTITTLPLYVEWAP